jgi:Flp pilus assembly protein TadD
MCGDRGAVWRVVAVAFVFAAFLPRAFAAQSTLLTVEGRVEVARTGSLAWTAGQTNQSLEIRDRVRTGMRSRATVRLSDLSVLRLSELTTIEIQPPAKSGNKPVLEQRSGATYFLNRERPSEVEFRTPQASGAIRGTEFNLVVTDDGRTILTLLDGEVALANAQGEVVLKSGEQGTALAGQPPTKTAVIDAINVIHWALYYPAIVDANELQFNDAERQAIADSLEAYRSGDLLKALAAYPEGRQPTSSDEKLYLAGLLLSVGRVDQSQQIFRNDALDQLVAAVKGGVIKPTSTHQSATGWMAESYYRQSQRDLAGALHTAREAVAKSPNFGFAHARVAELEFSFGNTDRAIAALDLGLKHSIRNAQAHALRGFLLADQNKRAESIKAFDDAIAIDSALGNAWLGRGLARIRSGDSENGFRDLQTAVILEPNRSVHRSYLGKAFSHTRDQARAEKELGLAKQLDTNDPTPWLYSSLLKQQQNRVNEAVEDLEKSQELNDNRAVYRSQLLLDQDRAVRSANLATIYRDAGLEDVSVREAQRAVSYDYANYSAHLFLASSYDTLRDPKSFNLRYETPFYSELLVANLLAPVGGGHLSQNISAQEYSRFFDTDHFGIFSSTEYLSYGHWIQSASQYGTFGNSSYSLDAFYRSDNGQRPNNDLEQLALSAKFKQQLTRKDSIYLEAQYYRSDSGDVSQYYDEASASRSLRVEERQEPNLFLGYHREWRPGVHTLALAGRLDDTIEITDADPRLLFVRYGAVSGDINLIMNPIGFDIAYRSELEAYTAELQQIYELGNHTLIAGARYQAGFSETDTEINRITGSVTNQHTETDLNRVSVYVYDQWQPLKQLQLTAGVSYDRLHYPVNNDTVPVSDDEESADQFSPKVGFIYTPWRDTHLRGVYTRSLGGVYFDQSLRLEPTQIAGFNQAFRSLVPESVAGLVPGTEFQTFGLGVDHHVRKTRTYLALEAELLQSEGERVIGVLTNSSFPVPDSASGTRQSLDFEERTLRFTVHQLLSDEWSFGASYRRSEADFEAFLTDIPRNVPGASGLNRDVTAVLHQVRLGANFNHPSGLFAAINGLWTQQSNQDYEPDIPGDDFWHLNLYAGWRFWRRHAEVRVGLLNVTDQDYQLNPLNLYNELPRDRTLAVNFKFYF